jgi:hypothetical protein
VASPPSELQAKGLNFRGFLRALEKLHDADTAHRVIEAVALPEARDALRYGRIIPTGWYPVSWHRSLHGAAQTVTHGGRDLARRIGYEGTRDDLGGVYKLIAGLLAPQTLVRLGNKLWSSYWQGGAVDTVEHGAGHVRSSFRECHGFDRNIWEDISGSCLAVLETAGAKDVRMRIVDGGEGANAVIEARWQL